MIITNSNDKIIYTDNIMPTRISYDDRGNVIEIIMSNGIVTNSKYNEDNIIIEYSRIDCTKGDDHNTFWSLKDIDEDGLYHYTYDDDNDTSEWWSKFDDNGKEIYYINDTGFEVHSTDTIFGENMPLNS